VQQVTRLAVPEEEARAQLDTLVAGTSLGAMALAHAERISNHKAWRAHRNGNPAPEDDHADADREE
jgi:hypothetical protein